MFYFILAFCVVVYCVAGAMREDLPKKSLSTLPFNMALSFVEIFAVLVGVALAFPAELNSIIEFANSFRESKS